MISRGYASVELYWIRHTHKTITGLWWTEVQADIEGQPRISKQTVCTPKATRVIEDSLYRRAEQAKKPCRYFTKTGAWNIRQTKVTDSAFSRISYDPSTRSPTFRYSSPHTQVCVHTDRPLQSRVDMSLHPRSHTRRHLSQVSTRQMPLHLCHLSTVTPYFTSQHPELYPLPSNRILS